MHLMLLAAMVAAPKLIVMPLSAKGLPPEHVEILSELALTETAKHGGFEVLGPSDINIVLGLDRMKAAVGCDDVACAAEIGGALGASLVLAASAGVLGEQLVLTAKLIDIQNLKVSKRVSYIVPLRESAYPGGIATLIRRVMGMEEAPAGGAPSQATAISPQATATSQLRASESTLSPEHQRVFNFMRKYGVKRPDYNDYTQSGMAYAVWAKAYNGKHESMPLEVAKWIMSATSVYALVEYASRDCITDVCADERGTLASVLVVTAGLWVWDLLNVGALPTKLP